MNLNNAIQNSVIDLQFILILSSLATRKMDCRTFQCEMKYKYFEF